MNTCIVKMHTSLFNANRRMNRIRVQSRVWRHTDKVREREPSFRRIIDEDRFPDYDRNVHPYSCF